MTEAEAREILHKMNREERESRTDKLSIYALQLMDNRLIDWILNLTIEKAKRVQDLVLEEKLRLETSPDYYQLARINESGLEEVRWVIRTDQSYSLGYGTWLKQDFIAVHIESPRIYWVHELRLHGARVGMSPKHVDLLDRS